MSAGKPHRENSGVLFSNKRKLAKDHSEQNQNRPDFTGEAVIGPERVYVSAWWKKDKYDQYFLSLSFRNANESEGA